MSSTSDSILAVSSSSSSSSSRRRSSRHRSNIWRRLRRRGHYWLEQLAPLPFYGMLLLLILMPLFYHGGEYWWLPTTNGLVLLIYAAWGIIACLQGGDKALWRAHPGLLIFALPLLFGMLQAMPLSDTLVAKLSPVSWQWWEKVRALGVGEVSARLSLAPDYTMRTCELLCLCLLIMVFLLHHARRRQQLLMLAGAVALSAFANAMFAFWVFWRQEIVAGIMDMAVFRGAFLNRNHFGFMMLIGAMTALGGVMALAAGQKRLDENFATVAEKAVVPTVFVLFGILTAQVLSLSRGAFMATVLAGTGLGLIWLIRGAKATAGRQKILALAVVLAAALLLALPPALNRLSDRYRNLLATETLDGQDRVLVWKDTLTVIQKFALTGTGMGAYGDAIQPLERGIFPDGLIEHAHNDWLEMMAEIGLPMALLIVGLAMVLLIVAVKRIWRQREPTRRWLGMGALAAIFGALIHEMVDFNLLAMPNAMLFAAVLTLAFLCAQRSTGQKYVNRRQRKNAVPGLKVNSRKIMSENSPEETISATVDDHGRNFEPRSRSNPNSSAGFRPGFWSRLAFLAMAILSMAFLPWQSRRMLAAWRHTELYREFESGGVGWQLGWKDYQRRMHLANEAQRGYPGHPAILRLQAICNLNLAYLQPGEAFEYMAAAVRDSVAACRRLPADGDTLRIAANIQEHAGLLEANLDEQRLMKFYELALDSQPKITNMIREVAEASRRSYLRLSEKHGEEAEPTRQQRQRTLELYLAILWNGDYYDRSTLAAIMELKENPQQLVEMVPAKTRLSQAMFNVLLANQQYEQAFALQEKARPDLGEQITVGGDSLEWARDWHERQLLLQGLVGQWQQRTELLPEYLRLAAACQEAAPARRAADLQAKGRLREAKEHLLGLRNEAPVSYSLLLQESEVSLALGKADEVPHILLPFAYGFFDPPSLEHLSQAHKLFSQLREEGFVVFNIRERFLRVALPLLLAEAKQLEKHEIGLDWAQELLSLEAALAAGEYRGWLQQHLLPFFAGRAFELAGDEKQAAEAYLRSLRQCAGNLYVLLRLERLMGGELPSEVSVNDREMLALFHAVQKSTPAMSRFTPSVMWCGLLARPGKVAKYHEVVEVDYLWLCTGEVQFDCSMSVELASAKGVFLSDTVSLSQGERSASSWRVGELVVKSQQYTPLLQMARSTGKAEYGLVTATVKMYSWHVNARRVFTARPEAVVPLFQVVDQ